jgi:serine O-acetyltransferase
MRTMFGLKNQAFGSSKTSRRRPPAATAAFVGILFFICIKFTTTTDAWIIRHIPTNTRTALSRSPPPLLLVSLRGDVSKEQAGEKEDDDNDGDNDGNGTSLYYNFGSGKNKPFVKTYQPPDTTDNYNDKDPPPPPPTTPSSNYSLGRGKNKPLVESDDAKGDNNNNNNNNNMEGAELHWYAPAPVTKPLDLDKPKDMAAAVVVTAAAAAAARVATTGQKVKRTRKMVARNEEARHLRGAIWHEQHFDDHNKEEDATLQESRQLFVCRDDDANAPPRPAFFFNDIDLSVPESVYSEEEGIDLVWDLMRWEAYQEAQREPLLVSFLHSTILNHRTLESSLAFLLANRLASPAMLSTQIQSLILDALATDKTIGKSLRADILAVRDRDPACTCLPDVFLYFKGFQALQSYRIAHCLWKKNKRILAHYLQSQGSLIFQIDIHPNATVGRGIMLDHGTGIVIGETAHVGHNCSILHHVTLGGSGNKGTDRHPKVGDGVLLGAGASVLGNVKLGDGCQIGAGTLVITDLPPHSVAVGVPAKIIGSFVDVTEQPSIGMNQLLDGTAFQSDGI